MRGDSKVTSGNFRVCRVGGRHSQHRAVERSTLNRYFVPFIHGSHLTYQSFHIPLRTSHWILGKCDCEWSLYTHLKNHFRQSTLVFSIWIFKMHCKIMCKFSKVKYLYKIFKLIYFTYIFYLLLYKAFPKRGGGGNI